MSKFEVVTVGLIHNIAMQKGLKNMRALQKLIQLGQLTLILFIFMGFMRVVEAQEVTQLKVDHADGRFIIHANILIAAPLSQVQAVLTNFKNLSALNPNIKTVEILESSGADKTRMQIQSRTCILFFCLDYQWVQETYVLASNDIITHFDPGLSDFHKGWVRYRLLAEGDHTRLVTDADLIPSFWIPPLLGPVLIKQSLRQESLAIALRIEQLTRLQPSSSTASKPSDRLQPSSNTWSTVSMPEEISIAAHWINHLRDRIAFAEKSGSLSSQRHGL